LAFDFFISTFIVFNTQSTSSQQTISLTPQPVPMAAPITIPPCRHSSTPQFNPEVAQELQQHFQELEMLFGLAQIVNNMDKKKHAC
jgi:hypothetical protein